MSLRIYLDKIKKRQKIDYDKFVQCLPSEYTSRDLFKTKLVSLHPKRWIVSCEEDIFNELWRLSEKPKSRVHASELGNSHKHPVSAQMLLVFHNALPDILPTVVYASEHEVVQSFTSKSRLLLIENEQNFINHDLFCNAIANLTGDTLLRKDNMDIAFGSGNKVTAGLLIKWYMQYDEVLCAFDYDLGGLQMYKTLQKNLKQKAIFIQPSSYSNITSLFVKKPKSNKVFQKARELAEQLGFDQLSQEFFDTRHFMEQEMLLKDLNV